MKKLSLVTTPVEVLDARERYISRASGFFYKTIGNSVYFITNWHVVTGRDSSRPQFVPHGMPKPHILRLKMHKLLPGPLHIRLDEKTSYDIRLYEPGGNAVWLEHAAQGSKVDVVAIAIEGEKLKATASFITIEDCDLIQSYSEAVMDDVFVAPENRTSP